MAENILKERVQSFGFRLWNDDMAKDGKGGADFAVTGEAKFKKLSAKLAASGITVEKFVLSSWTVKATDKKSGEEIYYNTQIPEKTSWATEDEALRDIGKLIGEEFSKGFFLAHFHFSGQKVRLRLQGLPNKDTAQRVMHELNGLHGVLAASLASSSASDAVFDLELSGGLANPAELVAGGHPQAAQPQARQAMLECRPGQQQRGHRHAGGRLQGGRRPLAPRHPAAGGADRGAAVAPRGGGEEPRNAEEDQHVS